ncbi:LEAF RUST 10 DISEASE-RESISTANCE LOCUS RECEPTOR-LIKE PROTEIN KINASE-like 2.5 isoform X2 [Andrographis paniculata]|uniref:LEAF RUST 10 DISEASE-RESISTANCE LOCUS RECEPTOR-LIKE PROTEIN KINASE-like 2.5 isoform X2 n=1 Tax=Andrographis paniculata TaxID=175694 RepID=UPI0021E86602|nr:LEAF RUST 10 DISEASE-RESISTANCE LOCUS RECEPTOR-LIKE PROTEIN KINASE-like 2.5 isoform X2 [Andrographis paniculata]
MKYPKFPKKFLLLLLLLIIFLSINFPAGSLAQPNGAGDGDCGKPFDCANKYNLTYPFYDATTADLPSIKLCGHPSFALQCDGAGDPFLSSSQVTYRLLNVSFLNHTLKLARDDLSIDVCRGRGDRAMDTIFDPNFFQISPESDAAGNITLYYDCSSVGGRSTILNQFSCNSSDGTETVNFFWVRNGYNSSAGGAACRRRITVPVDGAAARALYRNSSRGALQAAVRDGFFVRWSADNDACGECSRLGGACAYKISHSTVPTANGFYCSKPSLNKNKNVNPRAKKQLPTDRAPTAAPDHPFQSSNASNLVPSQKHRQPNQTRIKLGLAFGAIGLILAFILVSTWCWKSRYFPHAMANPNIEKFLQEDESLTRQRYRYSEIKKMTRNFNDKLGQGGYGSVYRGMLPNGCLVAVKVLVEMDSNDEEFINEVASISRTSHVNIVRLLGFCYEKNKRALVYEYMPKKSLDKYIGDPNTNLDVETLYKVALGVAKGLEYLHRGCATRIIHFDIKPQNILLDENLCPKISDFGLAKLCKRKTSIFSVFGTRGTIGYIAPEVFSRNFGGVSDKSDVYSYGIMILEMAGAKEFSKVDVVQSSENYFPDKIYEQTILPDCLDREPMDCNESMIEDVKDERSRKMFRVGFWCIQTMPSDRPSMSKVVEMLEGKLESIHIPPKPYLFSPRQLRHKFSPSLSVHFEIEASSEYDRLGTTTEATSSSTLS